MSIFSVTRDHPVKGVRIRFNTATILIPARSQLTMEKKYLSFDMVVGKQVIDATATIVGSVKEVVFDASLKTIAFTVTTKAGTDFTLDDRDIIAIGDVILSNPKEQPSPTVPPIPSPNTPKRTRMKHTDGEASIS